MNNRNTGFLITKIKQIGTRRFNKILSEANIDEFNGEQGTILFVLYRASSPLKISEIAKKSGLAKTTLTNMLRNMEKLELITIKEDENDKRILRVYLTPKSINLKEKFDEISKDIEEIYYKNFKEEEIVACESYLNRILNNLENEEK